MPEQIAATEDTTPFDNADIGEGSLIEPDVRVGFRYHPDAGRTVIGRHAILRKGTLIYGDVRAGDYFQTAYYTVIRPMVRIGDYCTIMNHSCIEGIVRMGNAVRIMSNVYIPSRTWFGDHVFVGPGVTFLNDRLPTRQRGEPVVRGATLEDEVMIGGGSTIMAGIRIGRRSFIAAGSVVVKDVPPESLVKGVPGRIEPLPDELNQDNDRRFMIQPTDIWHPRAPHPGAAVWPEYWHEPWQ